MQSRVHRQPVLLKLVRVRDRCLTMGLISGHVREVCRLRYLANADSHAAQAVPPRSELRPCDRLNLSAVCVNAGATRCNYKLVGKSQILRAGCAPRRCSVQRILQNTNLRTCLACPRFTSCLHTVSQTTHSRESSRESSRGKVPVETSSRHTQE